MRSPRRSARRWVRCGRGPLPPGSTRFPLVASLAGLWFLGVAVVDPGRTASRSRGVRRPCGRHGRDVVAVRSERLFDVVVRVLPGMGGGDPCRCAVRRRRRPSRTCGDSWPDDSAGDGHAVALALALALAVDVGATRPAFWGPDGCEAAVILEHVTRADRWWLHPSSITRSTPRTHTRDDMADCLPSCRRIRRRCRGLPATSSRTTELRAICCRWRRAQRHQLALARRHPRGRSESACSPPR